MCNHGLVFKMLCVYNSLSPCYLCRTVVQATLHWHLFSENRERVLEVLLMHYALMFNLIFFVLYNISSFKTLHTYSFGSNVDLNFRIYEIN